MATLFTNQPASFPGYQPAALDQSLIVQAFYTACMELDASILADYLADHQSIGHFSKASFLTLLEQQMGYAKLYQRITGGKMVHVEAIGQGNLWGRRLHQFCLVNPETGYVRARFGFTVGLNDQGALYIEPCKQLPVMTKLSVAA